MKRIMTTFLLAAGLVLAVPLIASAQTPDGKTPAVETVCDGEKGAAFGLCNAYCEAMDCDNLPEASPGACEAVRGQFNRITGRDLPCEFTCGVDSVTYRCVGTCPGGALCGGRVIPDVGAVCSCEPAPFPQPTAPPGGGCTLTQGFWKNHNRFRANPSQQIPWPTDEDTLLCGETWLDNLNTPPKKGNAFYILAHQWIAARLNVADGADDSDVAAEIAEAEALLNSCVFDTSDRDRAIELADILGDYNEGAIGPGHCDDVEGLASNNAAASGGRGIGFELAFLLPPLYSGTRPTEDKSRQN